MAVAFERLSLADFSGLVGGQFRLDLGEGQLLVLELVEAVALRARAPGNSSIRSDPFSLLLRGPKTPILVQRIHHLENDALGAIDLFIVPVGPDEVGQRYEAIFN